MSLTTPLPFEMLRRERAEAMRRLSESGMALHAIGRIYGISAERVRQVIAKHFPAFRSLSKRGAPRRRGLA